MRGDLDDQAPSATVAAAVLLVDAPATGPAVLDTSEGAQMRFIGTTARSPVVADDPKGARQPRATNTLRDLDREHAFLVEAARGHDPFVSQCTARLAAGDETFGDRWASVGIRKHLGELLEEAADLGAWSALATQALDREPNLSDVDRQRLTSVLAAAAEHGSRAHRTLTAAMRALGIEEPACR